MARTGLGLSKLVPVKVVPTSQGKFIYKLNSRDSSCIYGASVVRVFVLLFSFSILVTSGH